jgi:hypothetical protein
MNRKISLLKILGLSPNEIRIYSVLDGVPRTIAEIEKRAGIPHATTLDVLRRFVARGLASTVSLGGKRCGYMRQAIGGVMKHQSESNGSSGEVQVFEGKEALLGLIDTLLVERRGERMLSFHGTSVLPGWLAILSKAEIKKRNELIVASGIIIERFVPVHGYHKLFIALPADWQQTMLGRAHITYFLPDKLFTSKTEIILFADRALIYETDQLCMTIFSHRETVKLFTSWFQVLRTVGKKIDSEREFLKYIREKQG